MSNKINPLFKNHFKNIKRGNNKPHGKMIIKNQNNNIIELENVNKYYIEGNNIYHILKNVNLTIVKGKFIVIYGQSGSGKTTLLNVISGLDRATMGNVVVNDINLSSLKDYQMTLFRRKNVGFIFQSYNLLSDLNAHDNAKIGQVLQPNKSAVISIEELFADLEISHLLKQDIRNLSGGQQQRVAIARALSKNPKLIFADEPTGSLDSASTQKVIELLKKINAKYQTTVIVVTHDQEWMKVADQILEVKDGQVIVTDNLTPVIEPLITPPSLTPSVTKNNTSNSEVNNKQVTTAEVFNETVN